MSDIRDWLAEYGSKDWIQQLEGISLDSRDFSDWSEESLAQHGVTEQFIEYVTRGVRQLKASKRLLTQPQNRQVSVLFIDLVGSTALGQRLGDERAIPLKNTFRRACRQAMEEFGGNIMYSHHDEVVACFGFPIARERGAERAVRAALQINEKLSLSKSDERLQVRAGVSTARSVVGAVDPDSPELINAGMVVSHAARLAECAQPEEIRISKTTHALINDVVVATSCGKQELTGFSTAQESWSVVTLANDTEAFTRPAQSPLVGRETDLKAVNQVWQHCCNSGELQTLCITGDAGIGKSRLLQELRHQLPIQQSAMLFLCSPYHRNSALYPISQQMAWSLGISDDATKEDRHNAVSKLLANVDTQVTHAAWHLTLLLGTDLPDNHPLGRMRAEVRKQSLFELLRDIVLAQSSQTPLLAIIEDVHWIDPTTIQLIKYLNKEVASQSLMIVLTARTGFVLPDFIDEKNVMELQPLDRAGCGLLVDAVDAHAKLSKSLVRSIIEHCDGVPMFVEEVTRAHLASDGTATDQLLTPRLSDLLIANLDSAGEARSTAQLAAVIGKSFAIDMLEAVSELPTELVHEHVGRLRDKGLFYEHLGPEPTLSFRHALLRDCAYETLLDGEKRNYHGRVADTLMTSNSAPAEIVAWHLTEADRRDESIIKWQEAARKATQSGAYLEARAHLEAALALLPEKMSDRTTRRTRQELLLRMLPALLGSVSYGSRQVQRTMDDAIELSLEIGVDSRIFPFFYGRWINTQAVGKHAAALAYSEEFIQLAELHGDAGATAAAHINAAWSAFNLAQLRRARQLLERADSVSNEIRKHGVGFAYAADGVVGLESCRVQALWCLGELADCRKASARAIQRSQKIKNGQSIFLANQYCGSMVHTLLREWEPARQHGHAMMKMEKIAGAVATGQFYTSLAEMHLQQSAAQVDVAIDAERKISRMGFKYLMPFWLTSIAEVLLRYSDNVAKADELLNEATDIVDETGEHWFRVEHLRLRAIVSIRSGQQLEAAAATFQQACDLALEQGNLSFGLRAASSAFQSIPEPRFHRQLAQFASMFDNNETAADIVSARELLATQAKV